MIPTALPSCIVKHAESSVGRHNERLGMRRSDCAALKSADRTGSGRMAPMHSDMIKAIRAQAKNLCAAYRDGECLQDECTCHVLHPKYAIKDGGIDCDYFLTAVLPSDSDLFDRVQAEIYQTGLPPFAQVKKCTRCGKHFTPRSNRQMYCVACSVEEKKKNRRRRQHRKYWADQQV